MTVLDNSICYISKQMTSANEKVLNASPSPTDGIDCLYGKSEWLSAMIFWHESYREANTVH